MLASVLPGLRDLRIPLTAGFLWLVVLWLIFYPIIPSRDDAKDLIAAIYDLIGALGSAVILTVLTFIAYVLGIFVTAFAGWAWKGYMTSSLRYRLSFRRKPIGTYEPPREKRRRYNAAYDQAEAHAYSVIARTAEEFYLPNEFYLDVAAGKHVYSGKVVMEMSRHYSRETNAGNPESRDISRQAFAPVTSFVAQQMMYEIPTVALRALVKNKDLWDGYDRAAAESRFRLTVVVPIPVITFLVLLRLGTWGPSTYPIDAFVLAVVLLVSFFIFRDALAKQDEANDAILQAVTTGEVEFPVIERILEIVAELDADLKEKNLKQKPRDI